MIELSKINVLRTDNRNLNFKGSTASKLSAVNADNSIAIKAPLSTQRGYALAFCGKEDQIDQTSVATKMPEILDFINKPFPKNITVDLSPSSDTDISAIIYNRCEGDRSRIDLKSDFVAIFNNQGRPAFNDKASEEQIREIKSSINNLPFIQKVQQLGIDENFNPKVLLTTLAKNIFNNEGIKWETLDNGINLDYKGFDLNISEFGGYDLTITDPKTKDSLIINFSSTDEELMKRGNAINQACIINKNSYKRVEETINSL